MFAFLSVPIDTPPSLGSLADNQLCGLYEDVVGNMFGAYNAEGLMKICESLKSSSLTSLR